MKISAFLILTTAGFAMIFAMHRYGAGCCGAGSENAHVDEQKNQESSVIMTNTQSITKDPICGMVVDETKAIHTKRDGKTYFFCGDHCLKKFLAMPPGTKPDAKSGGCCG